MADPKHANEMTESERERTEDWFAAARDGITTDLLFLEAAIEDANALERADLVREQGRVVHTQAMVERDEEAFFTDQTKALRPPTQTDIDRTVALTARLGNEIARRKASQAAVKLVGDLATLVSRILA